MENRIAGDITCERTENKRESIRENNRTYKASPYTSSVIKSLDGSDGD